MTAYARSFLRERITERINQNGEDSSTLEEWLDKVFGGWNPVEEGYRELSAIVSSSWQYRNLPAYPSDAQPTEETKDKCKIKIDIDSTLPLPPVGIRAAVILIDTTLLVAPGSFKFPQRLQAI